VATGEALDELAVRPALEEPSGSDAFKVDYLFALRADYEAECH